MEKFDGFLFGNGFSINLLSQLKTFIPQDKQYLLSIDSFLKCFVNHTLSEREERQIFKLFSQRRTTEIIKSNEKMRAAVFQYCLAHDANIEYHIGTGLFQEDNCEYDHSLMKTLGPALYNIWHYILFTYICDFNLDKYLRAYNESALQYLSENPLVYTTNFDHFARHIQPVHLNGSFVSPFKDFNELVFRQINNKMLYYKCIWGWNGIGKYCMMQEYKKFDGYAKFFNFDFFDKQNFHIKHLLLYGLGFQKSGYIEELSIAKPGYEKSNVGGVVDEHILMRLCGLQTQKQLDRITISYYSDSDKERYIELARHFFLENVAFVKSSAFDFSIE